MHKHLGYTFVTLACPVLPSTRCGWLVSVPHLAIAFVSHAVTTNRPHGISVMHQHLNMFLHLHTLYTVVFHPRSLIAACGS
jgi:hypothetical protein